MMGQLKASGTTDAELSAMVKNLLAGTGLTLK
jgi:hypothetical protein